MQAVTSKIFDLSHPILDKAPCSFGTADKVPVVTFEEGDSHGTFFVTSRLDNLYSNAGTQIDFPGHLSCEIHPHDTGLPTYHTVGEYPLERFIGPCFIANLMHKTKFLDDWFDHRGVFNRERIHEFADFVAQLSNLKITADDYRDASRDSGAPDLAELTGVLLYSGNTAYWTHEIFESWEYRYFYAPYLSDEVTELLLAAQVSFVGIDAFQIENPIANFRGDELPLMINKTARDLVKDKLNEWKGSTNHERILGNGILIYESLSITQEIAGRVGQFSGPPLNFQLPGLDDDAIARPYFVVTNE